MFSVDVSTVQGPGHVTVALRGELDLIDACEGDNAGEVSEWPKEQHWKCCKRVIVSGVRISSSPFSVP